MKIWLDITNTPHVHFLYPIMQHLSRNHTLTITARDFSETLPLLYERGIYPIVVGDHKGKKKVSKVLGMLFRTIKLYVKVPEFDLSISIGGQTTSLVSAFRKKKSIIFTDNDLSYKYHSYLIGSYFVFPYNFDTSKVMKFKKNHNKVAQYHGFKEQVYIADYVPSPDFIEKIPFTDYLLVRPENLKASYVPSGTKSLVPVMFERFKKYNILYLPRYNEERRYAAGYTNIYMPDSPVNGLDACYYSKVVLTGAGTFAREAAMLGVPAVSFFPRSELLSVDRFLVDHGMMLHTREVDDIAKYIEEAVKSNTVFANNKQIQNEVLQIIDEIIEGVKL